MRRKIIAIVLAIIFSFGSIITYGYNKAKVKAEEERTVALNDVIEITADDMKKVSRDGDVNIGNGGNGGDYESGSGNGNNILGNEQDEGVRVTLVESATNKPVTSPIDFANNPRKPIDFHFERGNKLYYLNNPNHKLQLIKGNYISKLPKVKLPKIVGGDLATIKKYFGDETFLKDFSQVTGYNYDKMTDGSYKLMIEPVGYPKIMGKVMACSATELAIFDKQYSLNLSKSWIGNFTHLNLLMSMYLERDEFGIKAYTGGIYKAGNDKIIQQLGIGAVTFKEQPEIPEEPPEIEAGEYVYRTNTEVYTSLESVPASSVLMGDSSNGYRVNPTTVSFRLSDSSDGARIISQKGRALRSDDKVYVRWVTPSEAKEMKVIAEVRYMTSEPYEHPTQGTILREYYKTEVVEIPIKVEEVIENTPPNPVTDDRNDSFRYVSTSNASNLKKDKVEENSWREYELEIGSKDIYNSKGEYIRTVYAPRWIRKTYTVKLEAETNVYSDPLSKTAKGKAMKSGYGIRQNVSTKVTRKVEVESDVYFDGSKKEYKETHSEAVPVQGGVSYFSDFGYRNYFRLLKLKDIGVRTSELGFKENRYSTYNNPTHFTPIWYPDDIDYTVSTYVFDCWSPGGQLGMGVNDSIYIKGNMWDDYHVAPSK